MSLAVASPETYSPKVVRPKQCKLLGAKVKLETLEGICTTVGQQNVWPWALIEDDKGFEHHVFIRDLKRERIEFPTEPQPYEGATRRIGYGLWEQVWQIPSVPFSDLTHVDELEAAA